ncbi:hypothetical protein [Kitasatospora viridis]|uniref:Uncharacterized protein n=1 Tax=Kitasatospora viridis TaxID=281105 RepID=A0A561S9K6_9ACTN|nr:hypothetical protein [Kitasatospora viridis]TWF71551.1 hypothetical protein FHX73_19181 [Kitasatospora viridis]
MTALPPTGSADEVLAAGPFHAALSRAICAKGLSLDRIRDRLAELGLPVAVSTLSNWQRGATRPHRPRSLAAVARLDAILGLPPGTLLGHLGEPGPRGRARPAPIGTPRQAVSRLRAGLDQSDDPGFDVLAVRIDAAIRADGLRQEIRTTIRARRAGLDRRVVMCHTQSGAMARITAGRHCTAGRTAVDEEASLAAVELLFPPLGKGETYCLEHRTETGAADDYCGHWLFNAGAAFEATIRFAPEVPVARLHRIWRTDRSRPHKDLGQLRLLDNRVAHLLVADTAPGFHGVRWTG